MDWTEDESFWLGSPAFADKLKKREASEGLESATQIVSRDEVCETRYELAMIFVAITLDGRVLDRRYIRSTCPLVQGCFSRYIAYCAAWWERELDVVLGQNDSDLIGAQPESGP